MIEDLPIPFAAVATEVGAGHEIWLQRGPLDIAIRASYALPGIFEPVKIGKRYLFDGALVNPVPVTVCRALGDFVIAVNVTADMMYRSSVIQNQSAKAAEVAVEAAKEAAKEAAASRAFRRRSGMGAAASLFRPTAGRRPQCRDGDGGRLQHHPGPHLALAARWRPPGRDHPYARRRYRHVRLPPRRNAHRTRTRGGAARAAKYLRNRAGPRASPHRAAL